MIVAIVIVNVSVAMLGTKHDCTKSRVHLGGLCRARALESYGIKSHFAYGFVSFYVMIVNGIVIVIVIVVVAIVVVIVIVVVIGIVIVFVIVIVIVIVIVLACCCLIVIVIVVIRIVI